MDSDLEQEENPPIQQKRRPNKQKRKVEYDFFDIGDKFESVKAIIEQVATFSTDDESLDGEPNQHQKEVIVVDDLEEKLELVPVVQESKKRTKREITPPPNSVDIDRIRFTMTPKIVGTNDISVTPKPKLTDKQIIIKITHSVLKSFKIKVFYDFPLKDVFSQLAVKLKVTPDDIVLEFDKIRIYPSTCPSHLDMENESKMKLYTIKEYLESQGTKSRLNVLLQLHNLSGSTKISYSMAPDQSIQHIYEYIAKEMKTNEANVVIEYQGVKLHPHCVPDSVGILNNSVIDAYNLILYKSIVNSRSLDRAKTLIDTNEEKDTEDHVENLNMSLKISFKSRKILVRVSSTFTIQKVIEKVALQEKIAPTFQLSFDGDILNPNSTITENDIEDGDVLDKSGNNVMKLKKALANQLHKKSIKVPSVVAESKKKTTYRYKLETEEEEKILLVGEGNFSFSLSLAERYHRADNMICTCYDSEATVVEKYPESRDIIDTLKDLEGTLLFDIDGTKLEKYAIFKNKKFSKIIFNFPHVGLGIKDQDRNVAANQEMIFNFFVSAKKKLDKQGEIIVSLKTGLPYDLWDIRKLAKKSGLSLKRSMEFVPDDFPGYAHRRTIGYQSGISAPDNYEITKKQSKIYIFHY